MSELVKKSAKEINSLFLKKEISAKEIVDAFYRQIENVEPKVEALLSMTKELAYKQAKDLDEKIATGEKLGPMAGVPIVVKDVMLSSSEVVVKVSDEYEAKQKFISSMNEVQKTLSIKKR